MNAECGETKVEVKAEVKNASSLPMPMPLPYPAFGFTLIEVIIFLVLAGIILPLIFIPFMAGLKDYKTPEIVSTATFLGEELMEEIKGKSFDENPSSPTGSIGPESGEIRGTPPLYNDSTYDDVDDYNNLTENVSINNTTYNRSVTVFYVSDNINNPDLNTQVGGPTRFKRIEVTVTNAQIPDVVMATLVSN